MAKKHEVAKVYRLKVTLKGSVPKIWRRLEVPGDVTLGDLHAVLQVAMGWGEEHLHMFSFKTGLARQQREEIIRQMMKSGRWDDRALRESVDYGQADGEMRVDDTEDEDGVTLAEVAPTEKMKFVYEYDFGDSWDHEILVEKIGEAEAGVKYPRCTKGAGRGPEEDCGGVWGWAELVEIMANPKDPEYAERREWLGLKRGEKFDPEAFDVEAVNRELERLLR